MSDLNNPWEDMPQEEWDNLSDDDKHKELLDNLGTKDYQAKYGPTYHYTGEDEEDDRIVTDWFNKATSTIVSTLQDDSLDPNKEAADACDNLKDELITMCDSLKEFLLKKKS